MQGRGAETTALRNAWSMGGTVFCNQLNMEDKRVKIRWWLGSEAQERVWPWSHDLGIMYMERE